MLEARGPRQTSAGGGENLAASLPILVGRDSSRLKKSIRFDAKKIQDVFFLQRTSTRASLFSDILSVVNTNPILRASILASRRTWFLRLSAVAFSIAAGLVGCAQSTAVAPPAAMVSTT